MTYRTANQYAAKIAEARAALEAQRARDREAYMKRCAEIGALERQRAALLSEVNEAIAPLCVVRTEGSVFLAHSQRPDVKQRFICIEETMLTELPRCMSTASFAADMERVLSDASVPTKKRSGGWSALGGALGGLAGGATYQSLLWGALDPLGLALSAASGALSTYLVMRRRAR